MRRGNPPARAGGVAVLAAVAGWVIVLTGSDPAPAAPAADPATIGQRLDRAQGRLRDARDREGVLTGEVKQYGDRVRVLEARLAPLRARSDRLQAEVASLEARLDDLSRRLREALTRLAEAEAELGARQRLLADRLREIYVKGEPGLIVVLLQSGSLSSAVAAADLLEGIADRDAALARAVSEYADATRSTRDLIARTRAGVAEAASRVRTASSAAMDAKAALEEQRAGLAAILEERRALLGTVLGDRRQLEVETRDLQARSLRLAARIRVAQGSPSGTVAPANAGPSSGSGFAWPVSGTLTSPFGPRWGRMHEGLDIAGASGTPIRASAAGTVIVAGWSGGYGNLVVVDHGGGLSTAYAHNSSFAVSVGQSVGQGQVLAGMGTTGNSTGVHSHFEIRVNGSAVNPLGYL